MDHGHTVCYCRVQRPKNSVKNKRIRSLDGKRIAVIGVAASGKAAAHLALERGGSVHVSDLRSDASAHACGDELRALGIEVDLGGHPMDRIAKADTVVVSPGIPSDAQVLKGLNDQGIRWISEPEFAFRFFDGPLIVVTGTNGKTTTATLITHLLESYGYDVALGGNIGSVFGPAASELALRKRSPDWYVVEMSSFQLSGIDLFRADIGVFTNLAPDHLDRYLSVEEYYSDKANLFINADEDSRWVINYDDPEVVKMAAGVPGEVYNFSTKKTRVCGAYLDSKHLTLEMVPGDIEVLIPLGKLGLLGDHNVENALAAATVAKLTGVSEDSIKCSLMTAQSLPHRTEQVAEGKGIRWINDSKATNVAAARKAISSFVDPLIVLLGGKDKGEDFSPLISSLLSVEARVFAYGEAGPRIQKTLADSLKVMLITSSFDVAFRAASNAAKPGDIVLLSPACSSFDLFNSYEERGERFTELAVAFATEDDN